MRVLGDWLVPHLNGDVYAEKPPLFFWLSALGQALGLGFGAGRIVSGLSSLGTLLFTWALARRFLPDRAALLGACVLGTAVFFPWLSRFGILDVLLTFFVTMAVYGWIRGGRSVVLFYAGMGLAVLTKGPVGILLAVFGALSLRIAGGPGGMHLAEAAPPPRRAGGHVLWGIPLTLAIVLAWLVPACIRGGPSYTDAILWKQNVGRAVESWSHARPFWYYVPYLLGMFFPWVLFLPWAAPRAWRRKGFPRAMLLWAAFGLVFFSAVSGKRDRYLTPLFPALSIVIGAWVDGAADAFARRGPRIAARIANASMIGAGVGLVLTALALPLLPRIADALATSLPKASRGLHAFAESEAGLALAGLGTAPHLLGLAAFAAILLVLGRRGIRARRENLPARAAGFLAAEVTVLLLAHDLLLVPRIDEFKSPRPVAEAMNAWPGEVAAYPAHFSGAYNLYSGRVRIPVLETTAGVLAYLDGEGKRLVLTSEESYARTQQGESHPLKAVLKGRFPATPVGQVGHRDMLFLTNYEPPR
jgi:4-amino-4-deoxy-L-arabinose transferase-like glycosyltransferase